MTGLKRMNSKIRDAEVRKVPYIIVVGDKEMNNGTISVRSREDGDTGSMTLESFLDITSQFHNAGIPKQIQF